MNLQPWEIIAVKSEAAKKRLFPLAINQPKINEAPAILTIPKHFIPDGIVKNMQTL